MEKISKLEIWGIIFIISFGILLHFTFELSGDFWFVGIFSPVNESTWEHLKLAFFPSILWLLIELSILKEKPSNFIFAKTKGIFLMPFLIIIIFYSYKAILGKNILVLDILTFILSIILGTIISLKLMFSKKDFSFLNKISIFLLFILFISFLIFTFYPPRFFLFQDPVSGNYGIQKSSFKKIKIGEHIFFVELPITKEQKEKGLSGRDFLSEDQGMLFVFEKPDYYYFWMKGMNFPLDFVWILDNKIVDIKENVRPEDFQPPNVFTSKVPVDKVLELKAGTIKKNDIKIGDEVEF